MKTSNLVCCILAGLLLAMLAPADTQAQVLNDFDGDDHSDFAVYQPSGGLWFIRSQSGAVLEWFRQWGYPTAFPVPADYNNDGEADLAVYDRNGGYWYIMDRDGTAISWAFQWGWSTAVPVPADYDDDGYTDLGVYDTQTGHWYVYSLEKEQVLLWASNWGWKGDYRSWDDPQTSTVLPVPYDYDRDGIVDRAVYWRGYNMYNSGWWILGSSGRNFMHPQDASGMGWGSSSSIPTPGIYRGAVPGNPYPEGLCVMSVSRAKFATPYMHEFSMGTYKRTLPVPAHDFNGDGWDDHAVYDYTTGAWLIFYNDEDGNGAPPDGQVYEQPPSQAFFWGFNGAIPANLYSTIYSACGYLPDPGWAAP